MARTSVNAKDVADLAGVSRAAVSRSFTPGASVSAETRAKVFQAAETLGYQVNHLARGLIRSETGLVALIAAEINTPYRSNMLAALTARLQEAGKVALLINTDRSDASVERALRQAISYRTDAAVVMSGMPARSLAETCLRNGMRLVLINRDEERPGSIRIQLDDAEAGRQAFATLVAAGCKRLALATSQAGTPSLAGREEGFKAAASEAGVDLTVAALGMTSYQTGLDLGTQLMARPDRPDGVFCTTDLLACGVLDAARHRFGFQVPHELSVIGFDDIEEARWESYALTTFAQPVEGIADAAVDWLKHAEDPKESATTVSLPARMIWRGTVRPFRNHD
ncbi:LacI family DNA-binding transcriptional regulator [Frigidibacter sp. ROC022]|uniref:LacI family DNA-binding transcriptional regulator n=1 Tax=Frigidibacter sp. ROC022 TaxID=2971796 RepID=UPI00215ACE9A|nr:LacI family DNA-binding transcriptional regulator [Frigidibacter sp. ROC022]MCR8726080.1 LacI family DNA-binding transcriptional regulator [Frigidibacter sp. ROC022]